MKMKIDEYARRYNLSKEIIHSKIKAKKLNYMLQNGEIFIITDDSEATYQTNRPKLTVATIIELYKKENLALKKKIKQLEEKIDKLIQDKENMLVAERERIEKIYEAKDEQLKTILELIQAKMEIESNQTELIDVAPKKTQPIISLKEYLKELDIEPHKRKIIKKRFYELKGQDIRIIEQNGKIYLDFNRFDYSDLFDV